MNQLRKLVEEEETMSVREQCELLGIARSGLYYECRPESEENLGIMRRLDELHMKWPVYGSRRLAKVLEGEGVMVNRKRVVRLLQLMGIEAIYPKGRASEPGVDHRILRRSGPKPCESGGLKTVRFSSWIFFKHFNKSLLPSSWIFFA